MLKKSIIRLLTVAAGIALIISMFLLDNEDHCVTAILLAVPSEAWLACRVYDVMLEDEKK